MKNAIGCCCAIGLLIAAASTPAAGPISVRSFGAAGDGKHLDTPAIRAAVEACRKQGGGTILFPAGVYRTGAFRIADNIMLYLEPGAVILGSPDLSDYLLDGKRAGLISAVDAENVSIAGEGVIDGNGDSFMFMDSVHIGMDFDRKATRQGEAFMNAPASSFKQGPVKPRERPGNLIAFSGCRDVSVRDVTLRNSPFWTLHLAGCNGADVVHITIQNNLLVPNNDGIHCTTSRNIGIQGCRIEAGDDAIAVTGVTDHAAIIPGFIAHQGFSENVIVSDCLLKSRSAGIRVGYGSNSIRNCIFHDCMILDSHRGIGIFVRNEGSVSDIRFSNLIIETRLVSGHWWGNGEPVHISVLAMEKGRDTGSVSDVIFSDIKATGENGMILYGSRPGDIQNIEMKGIRLEIKNSAWSRSYGGNFDLRPSPDMETAIFRSDIAALFCRFVDGLVIDDMELTWPDSAASYFTEAIRCESVSNAAVSRFRGRQAHPGEGAVLSIAGGNRFSISISTATEDAGTFLSHSGVKDVLFMRNDLRAARCIMDPAEPSFILEGNLMSNDF